MFVIKSKPKPKPFDAVPFTVPLLNLPSKNQLANQHAGAVNRQECLVVLLRDSHKSRLARNDYEPTAVVKHRWISAY